MYPSYTGTLCFPISYFAPSLQNGAVPSSPSISIPYSKLCDLLANAELDQRLSENMSHRGEELGLAPGTRLRKRQRTLEEQPREEDEEHLARSEDEAEEKVNKEDEVWKLEKANG